MVRGVETGDRQPPLHEIGRSYNPAINAVFARHFSDGGIDMSRVTLEGASRYSNLLKLYSRMDITLDTYPYGGGTTPMESLIQGVPVIGLIGERFCSQHAHNNMGNTGHGELIAHSKAEFVDKAVALASDRERLLHHGKRSATMSPVPVERIWTVSPATLRMLTRECGPRM